MHQANILVGRYASQEAYEQSLSAAESRDAPAPMKVKVGTAVAVHNMDSAANANTTTQVNEDSEVDPPSLPSESVPKVHQEAENFDGDRVLANSILFLQDFGWWIEISYAVPEGDIGRAFEILKVKFIQTASQNLMINDIELIDRSGYLRSLDRPIRTIRHTFLRYIVSYGMRPQKTFVTEYSITGS